MPGRCRTGAPDLVLLDIHMPGMDGVAVLDILQQRRPHLPVIKLSAPIERETAEFFLTRGAVGYITKPFSSEELREEIARALEP